MTENLRAFLKEAEENEELKAKLKELTGEETPEQLFKLAEEYGFTLTKADFAPADVREVSDSELEAVAGGGCNPDCSIGRVEIPTPECGKGLWF